MATYTYEYLGSCANREVSFAYADGDTQFEYGSDSCCGDYQNEYQSETWTATLNSTAPVPINVWFSYKVTYDDPWTHTENVYQDYVTISSGQLTADHTFYWTYLSQYVNMCPGGGCANEVTTITEITLLDQPDPPEGCNTPGCELGITGLTITAPTTRGGNDGQIYAGVTGTTGTTIHWFINTILEPLSGVTHTFSGLTDGDYYIKALDPSNGCYDVDLASVPDGEFRTGDFVVISPTTTVKAVENPIILYLQTALNSSLPAYSVNTFTVSGSISDVEIEFALTFPYEYNAYFASKGFPDRTNYFLESILTNSTGVPSGTNSNEEIATSLAEALQKDAIISRLYYITSNSNVVTLIAREYGSGYDLSSSNVTITGSNLVLANTTAGVAQYDGQISSNYSLYTELFVDDFVNYGKAPTLTDYRRVLELELPFNKSNQHLFDLSSTLKNFVTSNISATSFTGYTYMPEYITGYYCKYGERYPLLENTNTKKKRYKGTTDYGYCCNAALNYEDCNSMYGYFPDSGFTIPTTGITFLNTAPNNKYSHRNGHEILYFVVPYAYSTPLAVYGNIHMYSGAEYTGVTFFDITTGTTLFGGVHVINVSYAALGLSSYETAGEKIRKVDIQVYAGGLTGTTYTELKSYLLEIDEQPDTFNVAFLSKLGTYETYSFYGEVIEGQDIDRDTYQKPYEIDTCGSATEGFQYNSVLDTDYTKTWVVNTGIIDYDNFTYLQGLLQSNRIYHYDDIHQNYLLPTSQSATRSTNTNEYSLQITFTETISENNVTQ